VWTGLAGGWAALQLLDGLSGVVEAALVVTGLDREDIPGPAHGCLFPTDYQQKGLGPGQVRPHGGHAWAGA
jgi:hypothetical protein